MKYTDENRGMIQYRRRAKQIIDFHGLRLLGNITPTDSDGEIEYKNKAWVFIEIKQRGKKIPYGQKLALERKTDDIARGGKEAVLFVAEHDVWNVEMDVDAAACMVRSFYFRSSWHKGDGSDLKAYVNRFVGWLDGIT